MVFYACYSTEVLSSIKEALLRNRVAEASPPQPLNKKVVVSSMKAGPRTTQRV